jgi:HPt (histidine-containing phosphotransfer) domain-containing protein
MATLTADMDQVAGLSSELLFGLAEPRTYVDLRRIAHAQAGNAASFGFDKLGLAARLVNQTLSDEQGPSPLLAAAVQAWLGELQQVCSPFR